MTTFLAVCGTIALLALIPALSVLYREFLDADGMRASILLTVAISIGCVVLWLTAGLVFASIARSALYLPVAALAGVAGFLASLTVRDTRSHPLPALLCSLGWTAFVFVPVAIVVFFPTAVGVGATAGPLDLGGALPVHVAVGSSALVVLIFARRWAVADRSHVRPRSWPLFLSGIAIWVGWTIGYVSLELGLDQFVTPRIIANSIIAPLLGIVGWLIGQRVSSATTTPIGVIAGLVSGSVAIAAGCAYFSPIWAGITGLAAGLFGAVFVGRRVRGTGRHAWFLVGTHLLAGGIGLFAIGFFGTGFGFVYDGQTTLIETQLVSIVAVAAWSMVVSLVLWLIVRRAALRSAAHAGELVQGRGSAAS